MEAIIAVEQDMVKLSHEMSYSYGLDPDVLPVFDHISPEELEERMAKYGEFLSIANVFGKKVLNILAETGVVVIISDNNSCILDHFGDEDVRRNLVNLNITPGAIFSEERGATNAVFLANLYQKPISLIGKDHFHTMLHQSACYCVPFTIGNLSGTIGFMTLAVGHSNYRLALLQSLVESIKREYELRINYDKQRLVHNILTCNSNNGIILIDYNGSISECNFVAEKIIGEDSNKIIGNQFHKIAPIAEVVQNSINNLTNLTNIDVRFEKEDGSISYCQMDVIHVNYKEEYRGTCIQLRDVTEKKALEQQVIVSDRFSAIGKLAAGLAHEIRNPLTSVMGFMQILRSMDDYDKAKKYIPIMFDELTRVKHLVSDFVVVSKPSAPNKKDCNLNQLISDTAMFMQSQALLKNVEVISPEKEEDCFINIDSAQIKQVLINTIQNAIEAIEHNQGKVEINWERKENYYSIGITDNGAGMDEEQLNNITTPFFTTKETGTGLGMSVCYRIIESHGGNIKASSKKGIGTRIEINLPI